MSKRIVCGLILGALIMSAAVVARADPFIYPPQNYFPGWQTAFPYQRNIFMNFPSNPVAAPGSGIPGATYEGTLDSSLMGSDYVTLSGAVSWPMISNYCIGINNTGPTNLTGTAVFHIDNTPEADEVKHVWVEEEFFVYGFGSSGTITETVTDPNGNPFSLVASNLTTYSLGENGLTNLFDFGWQTSPNPSYETITETFIAGPNSAVVLGDFHIATESVPEPATVGLVGLGGLALLGWWRRRR
ncbi:MAG: PEP-CTERM sorting domain-containing protein [Verrucomicrobiia bacterium]